MLCCECGAEMRETSEPIDAVIRGVATCVRGVPHYACDKCGNYVLRAEDATLLSKLQLAQAAHAKGLLSPDEIRALRRRFGLTQAQFEEMLGVSTPTASRWETGAMFPSKTADLLMKTMAENPEIFMSSKRSRRHDFPTKKKSHGYKEYPRWTEAFA